MFILKKSSPDIYTNKYFRIIIVLFYTLLWGSAYPLIKIGFLEFGIRNEDNISKCLFAGTRFAISGFGILLLYSILPIKGKKFSAAGFIMSMAYGIITTSLQYCFTYIGLSNVTGARGTILDQSGVFLIIIASGIFFKSERLTTRKLAGCFIGFGGIVLMNLKGLGTGENFCFGDGMMLLASFCMTIGAILSKFILQDTDAMFMVGVGQMTGGVIMTAVSLILGGRMSLSSTNSKLILAALCIISAAAYVLSNQLIKYNSLSKVSSYNLLIPVFGTMMSGLMLSENVVTFVNLLALLLVSLGIYICNTKKESENE